MNIKLLMVMVVLALLLVSETECNKRRHYQKKFFKEAADAVEEEFAQLAKSAEEDFKKLWDWLKDKGDDE